MGSNVKISKLRKFIWIYRIEMVLLQETKKEDLKDIEISSFWCNDDFDFRFSKAMGKSGGILSVWDKSRFQILDSLITDRFILIEGKYAPHDLSFSVMNVYAHCEVSEQVIVWSAIVEVRRKSKNRWFMAGDFNAIRSNNERSGCSYRQTEIHEKEGDVDLNVKLRRVKGALQKWNLQNYWNFDMEAKRLEKRINELDIKSDADGLDVREREEQLSCTRRLWDTLKEKEDIWRQKSKSNWLKLGDENTAFFHRAVKIQSKKRLILGTNLGEVDDVEPDKLRAKVFNFFSNHFRRKEKKWKTEINLPFKQLSRVDAEGLEVIFSIEEVKDTVWSCGKDKAPGPDGFNIVFFKKAWEWVKEDLMKTKDKFYRNGKLVANPTEISEYRPISLVSSLYKIIAKVLARRLRGVIGKVISETQCAFIAGRQIFDGILVANEVIHSLNIESGGRGGLILKLDFAKAYDCVYWEFLDSVQHNMGFESTWRRWIWECISTVRVSVLLNGSPTKEFKMYTGLRQGDPLSPFLFIMIMEALHLLLEGAVRKGFIEGADPRRFSTWEPIIEKFKAKLVGWKSRTLSFAGRVVLINLVLSMLSLYYMLIFLIPKAVISKIDKIRRGFLWGCDGNKNRLPRVSWGRLCCPKKKGGAGIINLKAKNMVLLSKWGWRFAMERGALWRSVISHKYGSGDLPWLVSLEDIKKASITWRGIVKNLSSESIAKWMSGKSFRWVVGDGKSAKWRKSQHPHIYRLALRKYITVRDMISAGEWKNLDSAALFERQFLDREFNTVRIIKREVDDVSLNSFLADRIIWVHETDGLFKVKKMTYLLLSDEYFEDVYLFNFDRIWSLKVPPKVKYFLWMLKLNRVPNKVFLFNRGIKLSDAQRLCPWWWHIPGFNLQSVDEIFEFCFQFRWTESTALAWFVSFAAALWSLWLARNDVVFKSKSTNLKDLLVYVKMRAYAWCKALKVFSVLDEKRWWDWPGESASLCVQQRPKSVWKPPVLGQMKFNVVGSATNKLAGCGGILRTAEGYVVAIFFGAGSTELDTKCFSSTMEVGAIFQGINVDAMKITEIKFAFSPRSTNNMADYLAKMGSKRKVLFKASW
ncbi:uncharacterized protein LOC120196577 [Hibiscus syriacus]|uniref:uncharacterized protein LOC120196577 n=1 Tax=Hibiscus syriacus TaxID=106335 RepID=UPI00192102D1|nr:uncharacterized protein LOC120196577 [Hibiscus syriacus]